MPKLLEISRLLRESSDKIALTQEDLTSEYLNFNPKINHVYGYTTVRNTVDVGEDLYNVYTQIAVTEIDDGNYIEIHFYTFPEDDKSSRKHMSDPELIGRHKALTYAIEKVKKLLNGLDLVGKFVPSIVGVPDFESLLKNLERWHRVVKSSEESYKKKDSANSRILAVYDKEKKALSEAYEFVSNMHNDSNLSQEDQEANDRAHNPTLNVPGLSTKVFSSVIFSIREALRKIATQKPNLIINGFLIGAKEDHTGDKRRETVYRHLFRKFKSFILGTSTGYVERPHGEGSLYVLDTPVKLGDIK